MSNLEILHGYRHLYRAMLRAVQFSNRSRYAARDHLRRSFRNEKDTINPEAIKRTRWFLEAAAKERGLEHKILKNLVRILPQPRDHMAKSWKQQQNLSQRGNKIKQSVSHRVLLLYKSTTEEC
jgi:complex 1 LYR family protein